MGLSHAKSSTQPNAYVKLVKNDGSSKSVDQLSYQSVVDNMPYAFIAIRPNIA